MAKYRKKPIVIEAVQNHDNPDEVAAFFGQDNHFGFKDGVWSIITLEGIMNANHRDWIIKGIKGEFYPCKPDIFEATYEKVDDKGE